MKKATGRNRFFTSPLFPAVISAAVLLLCFAVMKCFIFGNNTLAMGDAQVQYIPMMQELRDRIFGDGGFLYSWRNGLGSELYANIGYYMLSPVTLLSVLMKWFTVYEAFDFAVLVKAALSAGAFAYFLKKSFSRFDAATAAFSVMYSLCGFFTAYHVNIMWLDAMIFLPLIALGIERLVDGKSGILYCIALGLSLITCFYTGYILCIFSILYLLVRIFGSEGLIRAKESDDNEEEEASGPEEENTSNGYMLVLLMKFGFYSIVAGALSAFVLYPIYLALGSGLLNVAEQNTFLVGFSDFLASHFIGADNIMLTIGNAPFPNSFSGILTVLLVVLLMFTKNIKLGERITYSLLAIFLTASFVFSSVNVFWHGFSVPTAYMHRFAFIYSFVLILIAYKVFINIKSVKPWLVPLGGVLAAAACIYLLVSGYSVIDTKYIYVSLAACILYSVILIIYRFTIKKEKLMCYILLAVVICESSYSCLSTLVTASDTNIVVAENDSLREITESINDTSLYRSENLGVGLSIGLPGSMFGYNGISDYSSLNDIILNYSVGNAGIKSNFKNLLSYVEQTPVFNSFFALKYLYCIDEKPASTDSLTYIDGKDTSEGGRVEVYRYKYDLPVAFCVNSDIEKWNASNLYNFTSQNLLFSYATGIANVLEPMTASEYSAEAAVIKKQSTITDADSKGIEDIKSLTDEQKKSLNSGIYSLSISDIRKAKAQFVFTASSDAPLYMYYASDILTFVEIDIDGTEYSKEYGWTTTPGMLALPAVKTGSVIKITASLNEQLAASESTELDEIKDTNIQLRLFALSESKFAEGYEYLKNGALNITEHSDTHIKGTLKAEEDQVIFTSIPYSEGWSAGLDGKEAEVRYNEETGLIMLDVTAGEHTLELEYEVPGLKTGLLISSAALVLLVLAAFVENKISGSSEEE